MGNGLDELEWSESIYFSIYTG